MRLGPDYEESVPDPKTYAPAPLVVGVSGQEVVGRHPVHDAVFDDLVSQGIAKPGRRIEIEPFLHLEKSAPVEIAVLHSLDLTVEPGREEAKPTFRRHPVCSRRIGYGPRGPRQSRG